MTRRIGIFRLLLLASIVVLGVVWMVAGCRSTPTSGSPLTRIGTGNTIESASQLRPDATPGNKTLLTLGATQLPAEIVRIEDKGNVTFDIRSHGDGIERETYRLEPGRFLLVEAAGETYVPPVDLLRFPLRTGDAWRWKGQLSNGAGNRSATADITTSSSRIFIPHSSSVEAVFVEVNFKIEAPGADTPAERRLAFWFGSGTGILKREFGFGSMREPGGD